MPQVVSLPAGVIEVGPISATMASQTGAPSVPPWMEGLDLSALTEEEQINESHCSISISL